MDEIFIKLMQVVGEHLSGKALIVRDRIPATEGLLGEIHRDVDGNLIIDISPKIPTDEKRLHVFLHEVAHAKHHNYLKSDHYKNAPESVKHESLDRIEWSKEDTAEKSVKEWREYALAHADDRMMTINPFVAGLFALLHYPERKKHE